MSMKLYGYDHSELMNINKLYRAEGELMMEGMMLESVPVVARIKPAELRQALRLLSFADLIFVLTMVFRGSR